MEDVYGRLNHLRCAILILVLSLAYSPKASALGIDLLGEVAAPLIGPAKEKMKGALVYIWLQPYAGYATGSSDQKRIAAGGAVTSKGDLKVDGFLYGGRGGILLFRSLRVGVDYSSQSITRNTLVEGATVGTYVQQSVKGKNNMLGATFGLDLPYTPLQGFVTKYFKATVKGDGASDGDGWGGGVSFVLKNPFILSVETRNLNYSSATELSGKKAEASFKQYYVTLSFMLL